MTLFLEGVMTGLFISLFTSQSYFLLQKTRIGQTPSYATKHYISKTNRSKSKYYSILLIRFLLKVYV